MAQDNYMYEWRKAKEHYDTLEDGTIRIHDDAPAYVKESYQEYERIMGKVREFPNKKRTSHFLFAHRKGQPKDKKEEVVRTTATSTSSHTQHQRVKAVFDNAGRLQIAKSILCALMPEQKETYIDIAEHSATLPFWACYKEDEAVGFLALQKHTSKGAEIYAIAVKKEYQGRTIAHALLKECESWCRSDGIAYLQIKVPLTEEDASPLQSFAQSCHFCELESLSSANPPRVVMVKKL